MTLEFIVFQLRLNVNGFYLIGYENMISTFQVIWQTFSLKSPNEFGVLWGPNILQSAKG